MPRWEQLWENLVKRRWIALKKKTKRKVALKTTSLHSTPQKTPGPAVKSSPGEESSEEEEEDKIQERPSQDNDS